jgi:8-oxo-dGTP pyrophosphatase MutT (NUDIX family)
MDGLPQLDGPIPEPGLSEAPLEGLSLAELHAALEAPAAVCEPGPGEHPAAVLVSLREGDGGLELLLVRRADNLAHHPGQIAFPGGRADESDGSAWETALREAAEELDLPRGQVRRLGPLSPVRVSVSGHLVQPLVGLLPAGAEPRILTGETAAFFWVPLAGLIAAARPIRRSSCPGWEFDLPQGRVWGMTARVLSELLARLAQARRSESAGHLRRLPEPGPPLPR